MITLEPSGVKSNGIDTFFSGIGYVISEFTSLSSIVLVCQHCQLVCIARIKQLSRDGKELIIDYAIEGGKHAHQKNQVTNLSKELQRTTFQSVSHKTQDYAYKEKQGAMADITEHNSEKEREGHCCKDCRVRFFIHRNSVSIDNLLECSGELIGFEICRSFDIVVIFSPNLSTVKLSKAVSHITFSMSRAPEVTNEYLVTLTHIIQRVIDSLLLCNKPLVDLDSAC